MLIIILLHVYKIFFFLLQFNPNEDPPHLLSLIPWQGPFHVSFNAQQNVVEIYRFVFEPLYKAIFGRRKVLARKPKPFRISTLITACFGGWLLIRDNVLQHFGPVYKSTEFVLMIHLLEEVVPLVFHFYSVIFRSGNYNSYKNALVRVCLMFIIHCRRHYNKATLSQLSDLLHHETLEQVNDIERSALNVLTEKKVEVFHSLLRW